MRRQILVELDEEIVERLYSYGDERGWSLEETIRFLLGTSLPVPAFLSGPPFFQPTAHDIFEPLARIISAQGMAKCPDCLKKLDSESIMKGECRECGKKL